MTAEERLEAIEASIQELDERLAEVEAVKAALYEILAVIQQRFGLAEPPKPRLQIVD